MFSPLSQACCLFAGGCGLRCDSNELLEQGAGPVQYRHSEPHLLCHVHSMHHRCILHFVSGTSLAFTTLNSSWPSFGFCLSGPSPAPKRVCVLERAELRKSGMGCMRWWGIVSIEVFSPTCNLQKSSFDEQGSGMG